MDNLNPISDSGSQWSDSAQSQDGAHTLNAKQPQVSYHPSDLEHLESGKTYSFQFSCDHPSGIEPDIQLGGKPVPVTKILGTDGTVTLKFQVPAGYTPQSSDSINISLGQNAPASVSMSDFKMGESAPVDTTDLINDLFKEFPDLKEGADSTITQQDIQKIGKAVDDYKAMAKGYDPKSPSASTTYTKLQSALKNINALESKLISEVKAKGDAFGQKLEQDPQVNAHVQSKGSTVEQLTQDIAQQLQMLLLQMLPKRPKEPPVPITTTLMDSEKGASKAKKDATPSADEQAVEEADREAAAQQAAAQQPPGARGAAGKSHESAAESNAEFTLATKAHLIGNQFLASFLDPQSRQQFEKGGRGDEASALQDLLKSQEGQATAPKPPMPDDQVTPLPAAQWAIDPSNTKINTTVPGQGLDITKSDTNAKPSFLLNQLADTLVAGTSYSFEFNYTGDPKGLDPKNLVSVNLGGVAVPVVETLGAGGKAQISFKVPADYVPADTDNIGFYYYKGSPSVTFSDFQLGTDSAFAKKLVGDLFKQFPKLQSDMTAAETDYYNKNISSHIAAFTQDLSDYNALLQTYNPDAPNAAQVYSQLTEKFQALQELRATCESALPAAKTAYETNTLKPALAAADVAAYLKSNFTPEQIAGLPDLITNQIFSSDVEGKIPALPKAADAPPAPTVTGSGSMMSDDQEASALALDNVTSPLLKKSASDYQADLAKYTSDPTTYTWADLKTDHDQIYSSLIKNLHDVIAGATGRPIANIANGYDQNHATEYAEHLTQLLPLAQKQLGIPITQVVLPPIPALTPAEELLKNPNPAVGSSETVPTVAGNWYLVSGDVTGASAEPGKGHGGAFSIEGAVDVAGNPFAISSDEIDEAGPHRRYYWVKATGPSIKLGYAGTAGQTLFQNMKVRDLSHLSATKDPTSGEYTFGPVSSGAPAIDPSTPEGAAEAMAYSQLACPPISLSGDPDAGWYPQVNHKLQPGDNLFDGDISIKKNEDQAPLKNSGHPYWYLDPVADKNDKIVNGPNGAHGIQIAPGGGPTANGWVQIPAADYQVSVDVYVPPGGTGNIQLVFSAKGLVANIKGAVTDQTFTGLKPGMHHLTMSIPSSDFPADGTMSQPAIQIMNKGDSTATAFNTTLVPTGAGASDVYSKINSINPYNTDRSWPGTTDDFTKSPISSNWAIALTGNQMFATDPKDVKQTKDGLEISSNLTTMGKWDPKAKEWGSVFDDGGVISTQTVDPTRVPFSYSATFQTDGCTPAGNVTIDNSPPATDLTAFNALLASWAKDLAPSCHPLFVAQLQKDMSGKSVGDVIAAIKALATSADLAGIYTKYSGIQLDDVKSLYKSLGISNPPYPAYNPTIAFWTYGESQKGPDSPQTHASGSDPITEFDCEMGSDSVDGHPSPAADGMVYMRPGSYIGFEAFGHNEVGLPDDKGGTGEFVKMPDLWKSKDVFKISMTGDRDPKTGNLILIRTLYDQTTNKTYVLATQDLGKGPFSPMRVEFGLENPNWNQRGQQTPGGNAKIILKNMNVTEGPVPTPKNPIPVSNMDYTWWTPGGGGGLAYTPFPGSVPVPPATTISDVQKFLDAWKTVNAGTMAFAADIEKYITSLGAGATMAQLQTWMTGLADKPYSSYAGLTFPDMRAMYIALGVTTAAPAAPTPSLSDIKSYFTSWGADAGAKAFAADILKEIGTLGADDNVTQLQVWIAELGDLKTKYPTITDADIKEIYTELQKTEPAPPPPTPTLADMKTYFSSWPPAGGDAGAKALAADIVAEINTLGSSGTVAQLQKWMTDQGADPYTNAKYAGLTLADMTAIYTEMGITTAVPQPPTPGDLTALENVLKGWETTASATPEESQAAQQILHLISTDPGWKTFAQVKAAILALGANIYTQPNYPNMSQPDVQKIYDALGITTPKAPAAPAPILKTIEDQLNAWKTSGTAAQKQLATTLLAKIGTDPSWKTLAQVQTAITGMGASIYDQSPANPQFINSEDVQLLYADLGITTLPPDLNDPLDALMKTWSSGTVAEEAVASDLSSMTNILAMQKKISDLGAGIYTTYAGPPPLTKADVTALYSALYIHATVPNPPTTPLQTFENDLATWKASGTDGEKAFANGFSIPAGSTLAQVQASITALGQGIYTKFAPGLTQADVQKIYTDLTMSNPPAPPTNPLAKIATDLQQWSARSGATQPEKDFIKDLESKITSLGPTGTLADFQSWLKLQYPTAFTKYKGLTNTDMDFVYKEAQLASPRMPQIVSNLEGWTATSEGGKKLEAAMLEKAKALVASGGYLPDLQSWLSSNYASFGASDSDLAILFKEVELPAPAPSGDLAKIATDLDGWAKTPAELAFTTAIKGEITKLGAGGTVAELQSWLKLQYPTAFTTYKGLTNTDMDFVYKEAQLPSPRMPQIVSNLEGWTATSDGGKKLEAAMLAKAEALVTSGGYLPDLQAWFSSNYASFVASASDLAILIKEVELPPPTPSGDLAKFATDLDGWAKTPAEKAFTDAIKAEITKLGTGGTVAQLQSWLKLQYPTAFTTYKGLTNTDMDFVYKEAQLASPRLPQVVSNLEGWTAASSGGKLLEAAMLLKTRALITSGGYLPDLQQWFMSNYASFAASGPDLAILFKEIEEKQPT